MSTTTISMETLDDTIEKNDIVLIDFWAPWCGPCKMFGPIFEKVSEENPDIVFAKCNTEEDQQLAGAFGVSSIPTLAIFREKILIFKQPGALPEAALKDIIQQVKGLDMDDVRAKIAEEESKSNKS